MSDKEETRTVQEMDLYPTSISLIPKEDLIDPLCTMRDLPPLEMGVQVQEVPNLTSPFLALSGAWMEESYRYLLWRREGHSHRLLVFLMLNPSTADGTEDDPTIRRCLGFMRKLQYDRMAVVNLFAWKSTDPKKIPRGVGEAAWGPKNNEVILDVCGQASEVIAAWGASGRMKTVVYPRCWEVLQLLDKAKIPLSVLAFTDQGDPRHPLMLKNSCMLSTWPKERRHSHYRY